MTSVEKEKEIKGLVCYCVYHGQGAIVLDINDKYKNVHELFRNAELHRMCISTSKASESKCIWETHGRVNVSNGELTYHCYNEKKYDRDYNDGWKTEYFVSNLYDTEGNLIEDNKKYKFNKVEADYY